MKRRPGERAARINQDSNNSRSAARLQTCRADRELRQGIRRLAALALLVGVVAGIAAGLGLAECAP